MLNAGTKLGSYEIGSPIGAGGMGEVYLAHDTRLGRDVAIKVLPEAVADDPERLSRFQREAKMLAALNHPNIATIYGLEQSGATSYLVMELIPGEDLAARVKRDGAIPVEEALGIAKQIAEALEAAHEKSIIHRDLKPANVKVTPDGKVKVLDFGLAKAFESEASNMDIGNSPTLSMAATMQGVILGTAAYMSPEQAKGKAITKATDIWAFGCVLYEMLSGHHAFEGEDITEILAAVVRAEPDWTRLPERTPQSIRTLLRRCLRKDRHQRFQDATDARIEIEDALSGASAPGTSAVAPTQPRRPALWIAACSAVLLALAAVSFTHFREMPPQPLIVRFQIPLPDKTIGAIFQLSPDGRMLAFTAAAAGRRHMWLRPIDSLTAQAVPGTEDATYPFWSPDSANIAFFVPGKLKKIAVAGGPPQTICDAPEGRGGTWNSDGVIVFSPGLGTAIERVSAAGGVPAAVTKIAFQGELQRYPIFLPDKKHFLYLTDVGKPETNGINVGSLDGSQPVHILSDSSSSAYVTLEGSGGNGLLLFRREGTLMGVPFDPRRLQITGEVYPIAEGVGTSGNTQNAAFSISDNGILAYGSGLINASGDEMVWMDRMGKRLGTVGAPGRIASPVISPDGKTILYSLFNVAGDASDLWLMDMARGVPSRGTFRSGISADGIWSRDGSTIVFQSDNLFIYRKPANGTGKEELLWNSGINNRPQDWSRDGKFVVYMSMSGGATGYGLWLLPMEGDHKPVPYLLTSFNQGDAQFSPDGKWMAYASNESGQPQVYVQAIPANGAKWQVSPAGGTQPRWRGDGKELFYISSDQKLMAVSVKSGAAFEAGAPQPLFELDPVFPPMGGRFAYQPAADGQRFLVLSAAGSNVAPPINVVLNWQAGLKK
ncbi:MAG: protein kinase [Acidobacteriia bacterium]|nr:protein kinase [Terriglobia bacterium]